MLLTALLGILLIAEASADGSSYIRRAQAFTHEDSLHIDLLLDLSNITAGSAEAFLFTPVLRSADRMQELPAVIVSGRRRARADHRRQALQPAPGYIAPFCTLYSKNKKDSIPYRLSIAYSPWMQHASLVLMREERDCCRMKILGVESLIADLDLSSPFSVPQGQIAMAKEEPVQAQPATVQPLQPQPVTPPAVIERREAPAASPSETTARTCLPCMECTAMVTYLTPDVETRKNRSESATLYIDYPTGVYEVRPDFRHNRAELQKLDSLLRPLTAGNLASISAISICGYASPDGTYIDNETLASNRARCFEQYMRATYRLKHSPYKVSFIAEDWDGLVELLQQRPMPHSDEVLSLIARTGIFQGREKQLMDLRGGTVYRELLKSYFPQLRRIRVSVGYEARAFNIEEAASLIYTHPRLLSLQEMYRVAAFYRPGTEQYREVYEIAAYHFPDDVLANINAASAVIMAGDPISAHQYLDKVADDPRSWNDFGVLAYLEGDLKKAEEWFRKALGVEPEKARKNLMKMKNEE